MIVRGCTDLLLLCCKVAELIVEFFGNLKKMKKFFCVWYRVYFYAKGKGG